MDEIQSEFLGADAAPTAPQVEASPTQTEAAAPASLEAQAQQLLQQLGEVVFNIGMLERQREDVRAKLITVLEALQAEQGGGR